ncbi:MAG: aminotransferase class III-fold pyridoxal phosphate-dependent enzyme, partial [Actinobacteria bacterium]|nr:aminotransferase class III-fold pyridoxal phosphate-dependent enzyme [Actinomycetota bacterium]
DRYGYVPDIITSAKGLTSGYSPLGAVIVSDRIVEPFLEGTNTFAHGITFGGHPVSCAVALKNLQIMDDENVCQNVLDNEGAFEAMLRSLTDIPIVGDVRGAGYFWAIELVRDQDTKESLAGPKAEQLLRGILSPMMFDKGLICRADDRGEPVLQLSPPLIAEQAEFDFIEGVLRECLSTAAKQI